MIVTLESGEAVYFYFSGADADQLVEFLHEEDVDAAPFAETLAIVAEWAIVAGLELQGRTT